jgi:alkylation response protein AidB-like acyl-CoA dehydrogenase
MAFPDFIAVLQPVPYWYTLFAAIPLGCARGILDEVGRPTPTSAALRLRLAEAQMRYESLHAYVQETARDWRLAAGQAYGARVLRMKTFVSQESTKLCAELFALSGGRSYRRAGRAARLLADSFAGTALRPPLALGLETLSEQFSLEPAGG